MKLISLAVCLLLSTIVAAEEAGKTVFARGDVVAKKSEAEFRDLKRNDPIFGDDFVTTGIDARAVLRLSDDTVITLGEEAEFSLEEYVFNETEKRAILDIPVGAFRIITGKLTKTSDPKFTVKTPRSTIAVRGTDFWGGSIHEGAIDIALLEGEHALVVSNEYGSVTITEPGFGTSVYDGKAPTAPIKWPDAMFAKAVSMIAYDEDK